MKLDEKFSPRFQAYCLFNGKQMSLKVQKKTFENNNFLPGDILYIKRFLEKPSVSFVDGKFVESEAEKTWWVDSFTIIKPEEFDKLFSQSLDKNK